MWLDPLPPLLYIGTVRFGPKEIDSQEAVSRFLNENRADSQSISKCRSYGKLQVQRAGVSILVIAPVLDNCSATTYSNS